MTLKFDENLISLSGFHAIQHYLRVSVDNSVVSYCYLYKHYTSDIIGREKNNNRARTTNIFKGKTFCKDSEEIGKIHLRFQVEFCGSVRGLIEACVVCVY